MVKLQSPFYGESASGTLADTLQYQNHGRRQVAGRRRVPTQPRTVPQMAPRRYVAALSKLWNTISIADKATWGLNLPGEDLPNYNHFLRYNINRFKDSYFWPDAPIDPIYWPAAAFPAAATTNAADITWSAPTPGSKSLTLNYQVVTQNDGWILTGHRWIPGDSLCHYRNLIFAEPCPPNGVYQTVIHPLPAGWMLIRCGSSSRTGKPQPTFSFHATTILA